MLHGCAAVLLYDPTSIRYALDVSNMPVWFAHNSWHYALVCADGPAIDFSYAGSEHLAEGLGTVDEARTAIPWIYWQAPGRVEEEARRWAGEIADLLRTYGGGNRRLAVDKCEPAGGAALVALGIEIVEGQELREHARRISRRRRSS